MRRLAVAAAIVIALEGVLAMLPAVQEVVFSNVYRGCALVLLVSIALYAAVLSVMRKHC